MTTVAVRPFRRADRDQVTALVRPDASAARSALAGAAVAVLRRWRVRRAGADLSLPAPGVYGVPEQWPHVRALLERAGFVQGPREELVYLADVAQLPRSGTRLDLQAVRTLGVSGTRLAVRLGGADVGYVEVDTGIDGPGHLGGGGGWADVANLHVDAAYRHRGIEEWLLGEAADWLRLARVSRLLAYATPDEADLRALLERLGFRLLTRTAREWDLR